MPEQNIGARGTAGEVFLTFLKLGLTSFGGPVAHLGYFRTEFVARRGWISEADYADLVALCQFLPGPASSQVGMAIGKLRAGYAGSLAAFAGFTLPSVAILLAFALGASLWTGPLGQGILLGLKIAALAVVLVWLGTGPLFRFSSTWQLVINTGTTIVTFLMVFLIQNSQNRDAAAMQAKLDELLRAIEAAREQFIGIEHLTEDRIERILSRCSS